MKDKTTTDPINPSRRNLFLTYLSIAAGGTVAVGIVSGAASLLTNAEDIFNPKYEVNALEENEQGSAARFYEFQGKVFRTYSVQSDAVLGTGHPSEVEKLVDRATALYGNTDEVNHFEKIKAATLFRILEKNDIGELERTVKAEPDKIHPFVLRDRGALMLRPEFTYNVPVPQTQFNSLQDIVNRYSPRT